MSVEARLPGYSTNLLVADMHHGMGRKLAELPPDEIACVAFVLPDPDSPSISYGIEALAQGNDPGIRVEVWVPGFDGQYQNVSDIDELRLIRDEGLYVPAAEGATLDLAHGFNQRKDTDLDGAVFLTFDPEVAEIIDPELDLDGMSPHSPYVAATSEGMVYAANHVLQQRGIASVGELAAHQIVVLGNGGVGGPLVDKALPRFGITIPPENHYRHQGDLDAGAERLATDPTVLLGFTATRKAAHITHLNNGAILVDVGYAINPEDGRAYGNAHPDLVARNGQDGIVVFGLRDSCGPVTIAHILERTVDRRVARASRLATVS